MSIDDRLTDQRLTDIGAHSHILLKISNGHNSAMHHPIPFVFGSRFLFHWFQDARWRPAAILENFKWPNLWNALSDSLYVSDHTLLSDSNL